MKNADGKYLARTTKYSSYDIQSICESLCSKPGTGLQLETIAYHVKLFLDEMMEKIEDGNKINTGYFTAQAHVKGSFDSLADDFDENKHSVDIVFSAGHFAHKAKKNLKVEIQRTKPYSLRIWTITDLQTKQHTDKLIANRILVMRGDKIKITGDNPSVGLYLRHNETGNEIHFPPTVLFANGDTKLELIVPQLAAGSYQLKVTTQYAGNGKPLAQPRSYIYEHTLYAD
jgi:hypothetical protein